VKWLGARDLALRQCCNVFSKQVGLQTTPRSWKCRRDDDGWLRLSLWLLATSWTCA